MKNKHYTLIGAMACMMAFIFAFAPLPDEVLRMTIVHQEGGEVTVYDTLVEVSGGYSIQQYLISKGFNPRDTEIIQNTSEPNRIATSKNGTENIFVHASNIMLMDGEETLNAEKRTITITKVTDENGVQSCEKKVNGIIVECDESSTKDFQVLIDDYQTLIDEAIDIEISDVSGDETMVYAFKTINDDGDEDEEVRVEKVVYSSSIAEGDIENEFIFNFTTTKELENPLIISPNSNSETKTIAIVTKEDRKPERAGDDPDGGVSSVNENAKLPIEDLSFFPNPSEGNVNLQFFLPQRGQTEIAVFDLAGKEVYASALGNFQGRYNEQLDFTNLETGMYIMRISQNNLSLAEKLIIK